MSEKTAEGRGRMMLDHKPSIEERMHCAIAAARWDDCFALLAEARAAGRREAFEDLSKWAGRQDAEHLNDPAREGYLRAMSYVCRHIELALAAKEQC